MNDNREHEKGESGLGVPCDASAERDARRRRLALVYGRANMCIEDLSSAAQSWAMRGCRSWICA